MNTQQIQILIEFQKIISRYLAELDYQTSCLIMFAIHELSFLGKEYWLRLSTDYSYFVEIENYLGEEKWLIEKINTMKSQNPFKVKELLVKLDAFFEKKAREGFRKYTQETIAKLDLKLAELQETPGLHPGECYTVLKDLTHLKSFKEKVLKNFTAFHLSKDKLNAYEEYMVALNDEFTPIMNQFLKTIKTINFTLSTEERELYEFSSHVTNIIEAKNKHKTSYFVDFITWLDNSAHTKKYEEIKPSILKICNNFIRVFENFQKKNEIIEDWFKDNYSLLNKNPLQAPNNNHPAAINVEYFFAYQKFNELKLIQHFFKMLDALKQFERDGNFAIFYLSMKELSIINPITETDEVAPGDIQLILNELDTASTRLIRRYREIKVGEARQKKHLVPENQQNKEIWKKNFIYGIYKSKLFDKPYSELAPAKIDEQSENIIILS